MGDVLTRLTSALDTRYRISRQVGVGGMATVFLAHDLRHERDVAIKVLHPDLAAALGGERFLAEIKTTAKLQHPHILPLLDSGEADGLLYYVMPYIAGESLRSRLERETQLAVDDAIRLSREVASALDYAHRHGVVHRDIKPENILIHEDQALVADFGIALAVSAAGGARMTQTGLSLGTPQYMAPEQAMGERAIDGRADIYALGAVTYEMLVGEPPFTGPTVQAIVARVMTESPRPVTGQRRSVQGNVNAAVLRALEKLPADRFHTAAEFSAALTEKSFHTEPAAPIVPNASVKSFRIAQWLPWGIAAVAAIAAVAFAVRGRSSRDNTPIRASLDVPADAALPVGGPEAIGISPDGQTIAVGAVINGQPQVLMRRLDEDQFRRVQGSQGLKSSAVFSRDGKWLAFEANAQVFRAPVAGGPATPLATSRWGQIAWTNDNHLLFTKDYNTGLFSVSFDGRDSAALTTPDRKQGELGHWWPQALPDGDHILFTNYTTPADRSKIEVLSLKTGKRTVVLNGGYFGRYADGHLLFIRSGTLMAVPMDASSLKTSGSEVPVPVEVEATQPDGWAAFAIADNGTMVYLTDAARRQELVWTNDNGDEESAVDSAGSYSTASPSPDGKKIAVVKDGDLWIVDRARKLQTRLTRTPQPEINLVWTPDSRSIIYARDNPQYDIYWQPVDGSGTEQRLVTSANDKIPNSVSPDGKSLLYYDNGLFALQISDPTKKQQIREGDGNPTGGSYSPNGKWISYLSNESGRLEVYVMPSPGNAGPSRQQVTDGGAEDAQWAPDGASIYYTLGGQLARVKFNAATGDIGSPEILKRVRPVQGWYVGPDGRILTRRIGTDAQRHSVKILFNWTRTIEAHN